MCVLCAVIYYIYKQNAALAIRALPHGLPHIAARLPSENLCGVSAEKGKFSVSRTVCK